MRRFEGCISGVGISRQARRHNDKDPNLSLPLKGIENIHIPVRQKSPNGNPEKSGPYFRDLSRGDLWSVGKRCALLSLADAIEMSHTRRIRDVKMYQTRRCWQLQMYGEGTSLTGKMGIGKVLILLEDVFKTHLEIWMETFVLQKIICQQESCAFRSIPDQGPCQKEERNEPVHCPPCNCRSAGDAGL